MEPEEKHKIYMIESDTKPKILLALLTIGMGLAALASIGYAVWAGFAFFMFLLKDNPMDLAITTKMGIALMLLSVLFLLFLRVYGQLLKIRERNLKRHTSRIIQNEFESKMHEYLGRKSGDDRPRTGTDGGIL